jgi:putative PIN family toxin of toxin-antitoxin system
VSGRKPELRVVLDTNVLVSGIFFTGPPFEILRAWRDSRFVLFLTEEIVAEYAAVLERLRVDFVGIDAADALKLIIAHARLIVPVSLPAPASADPDDDKFLACALAAPAHYLVSGDQHLLTIDSYDNVRIVRPRTFLDVLTGDSKRGS